MFSALLLFVFLPSTCFIFFTLYLFRISTLYLFIFLPSTCSYFLPSTCFVFLPSTCFIFLPSICSYFFPFWFMFLPFTCFLSCSVSIPPNFPFLFPVSSHFLLVSGFVIFSLVQLLFCFHATMFPSNFSLVSILISFSFPFGIVITLFFLFTEAVGRGNSFYRQIWWANFVCRLLGKSQTCWGKVRLWSASMIYFNIHYNILNTISKNYIGPQIYLLWNPKILP